MGLGVVPDCHYEFILPPRSRVLIGCSVFDEQCKSSPGNVQKRLLAFLFRIVATIGFVRGLNPSASIL
jgi:hypothetical protein